MPQWLEPLEPLLVKAQLAFAGMLQLSTPSPAPATAPLTVFSTERAMART